MYYEKGKWYIDHGYSYYGQFQDKKDAESLASANKSNGHAVKVVHEFGSYSVYVKRGASGVAVKKGKR